MKNLIFISLLFTLTTCSKNSTEQVSNGNPDPTLNEIQNEFLNNQARALLIHVNKILDQHLPGLTGTGAEESGPVITGWNPP